MDFTEHNAKAILRYNKTSTEIPTTKRMNCSQEKPCRVLNCQFSNFAANTHTICDKIDDLISSDVDDTPSYDENSKEYFMNFVQIPGGMGVDGKIFEHPGVNSLTQSEDISIHINCDKCEKIKNKGCACQNELNIPFNRTIQMVWTNHGKGATRHHPIHLHGHSFHVLKMGYPESNSSTGFKMKDNTAIECDSHTEYCNNPAWKNKVWANGNAPGLKLKNAPKKDTLMIPAGAYAVIRFRSDNPGKWFMHCHIEFHSMQGMRVTVFI